MGEGEGYICIYLYISRERERERERERLGERERERETGRERENTCRYVTTSPRMMASNSRAPISPAALHSAPLRVMCTKSDSDMWIL